MKRIAVRRLAFAGLLLCVSVSQAERYTLPLLVPPGASGEPQGMLRILNGTDESGTVQIVAIDDAGARTGPIDLALNPWGAVEFTAAELQSGNAAKGLASGLGDLAGDVRLLIDSDVAIVPSAYVRSGDGALAALHDTVLEASDTGTDTYRYDVAVFHPAANVTQQSRLRLINAGDEVARIVIEGRDDAGLAAVGGTVELTLPGGAARTLTAQQLEAGDNATLTGRLGAGTGDWRLSVLSDRPIDALNLTVGADGGWSNLSTTAVAGWAPEDETAFEARFLKRVIVSRDGLGRLELRVLAENRFRATLGLAEGGEASEEGGYRFERTGRDAGLLTLLYDNLPPCAVSFYFDSPISGWFASGCVNPADAVEDWGGGGWRTLDPGAAPLDLGSRLEDLTYTVGTAIDVRILPAASGGSGELTYSLSPEVPGLQFDASTRELSGTPSEAGSWVMTYRVRDASGDSDWRYFNVKVRTAGDGGPSTTFDQGDTLSDLPTGSWDPDALSSGHIVTIPESTNINLEDGGYVEEGDDRFTCQDSGGCIIVNRQVTSGTIARTAKGSAPGGGVQSTTFGMGDTLSDLPTGSWDPDEIQNATRVSVSASKTIELFDGGYIEQGDYRFTCQSSGGCTIVNQRVTSGTIIRTASGTEPGGGGAIGNFDLHDDNAWPSGIAHANGLFHVVDVSDDKVYAYTGTGEPDASADFDLHVDNLDPHGIAHANGGFLVVDGFGKKAYAYTGTGEHDASADFDLHDDNLSPAGVVHANDLFYVVDSFNDKVYAYAETGERDASAEFDLHEDNGWPRGIAHANGRFYVVDVFEEKVYAYTDTGERDASSDFDLLDENLVPAGIAHANGRFYVVDFADADSRVYEYGGTEPGVRPGLPTGGGPDDGSGGTDDYGDDRASATAVGAGSDTQGVLTAGDVDYFSVEVSASGTLEVYTSGDPDTLGQLEDSTGSLVDDDDDGGANSNFRIVADVTGGTYYVRVSGFSSETVGDYTLHVRFAESTGTADPPSGSGAVDYFDLGDFAVALDIVFANARFYVVDNAEGTVYAYTASGDRDAAADFDLDDDNDEATGIAHADGRFYVVDSSDDKVYAYTTAGNRAAAADFDLDDDNDEATGIAHADGRFYVVDWWEDKVYAYTNAGDRDTTADFDLHAENGDPGGIVHANGRFHVVDSTYDKAYAYTSSGDRDAAADFVLDFENGDITGIAHANGRFHVVDWIDDKVYAYTASGIPDPAADFNLGAENINATGIVHASGRFYLLNSFNNTVYAYTASGSRDASADFDLDAGFVLPEGIAYANGRFYMVDWLDDKVFAYTASGARDAAADFDLDAENGRAGGIVHTDDRFFVVDSSDEKVYAYTDSGARDAAADFDLDDSNGSARGIAHANGRFYVVDWWNEKVYAYSASGSRDAAADFDLHDHNIVPEGIAFANGRLHVVDAGVDRVYSYPVPSGGDTGN